MTLTILSEIPGHDRPVNLSCHQEICSSSTVLCLSLDECSGTLDDVAENIETLRIERLDFIQLQHYILVWTDMDVNSNLPTTR